MPQPLTDVDICNLALANINQQPILTLGDANELARMCKRWYDPMRRELLEDCDWTFARKTFKLNLIGEMSGVSNFPDWATPSSAADGDDDEDDESSDVLAGNAVFPWAFLYAYPANVLYVHKVFNQQSPAGLWEWSGYAGQQFKTWLETQQAGYEIMRSKRTNELAIASNISQAYCRYTVNMTDTSQFTAKFTTALSLKIAQRIVTPLTGDKELKSMIDADLERAMTDAFRNNHSEAPEYGPRSSAYEDTRGL